MAGEMEAIYIWVAGVMTIGDGRRRSAMTEAEVE